MWCFLLNCIKPLADLSAKLPQILFFISVKHEFWVNLDTIIPYVYLQTKNIIKSYWNLVKLTHLVFKQWNKSNLFFSSEV